MKEKVSFEKRAELWENSLGKRSSVKFICTGLDDPALCCRKPRDFKIYGCGGCPAIDRLPPYIIFRFSGRYILLKNS